MALKTGFVLGKYMFELDGTPAGFCTSFTAPDSGVEEVKQNSGGAEEQEYGTGNQIIGKFKWTANLAHVGAAYELIRSVLDKSCKEFQLRVVYANQDYKAQREVICEDCVIEKVSFKDMKGSDGKAFMDYTVEGQCYNVQYNMASGDVAAPVGKNIKQYLTSNFEVSGLPFAGDKMVTEVSIGSVSAKIAKEAFGHLKLPELHYANWSVDGHKMTFAQTVFPELKKFHDKVMKDRKFTAEEQWSHAVNLLSPDLGTTLSTFTYERCMPKKIVFFGEAKQQETMANSTLEYAVQRLKYEAKVHS